MTSDGKKLENLVAFAEKLLLPQGFEVKTNKLVYNDEGIQIAELDIEVTGKLGSTQLAWLIECRDRPSSGKAPISWVEQLVGRRDRLKFNKVTAVSTTGFAPAAIDYAKKSGIELREVKTLSSECFDDWFQILHFELRKNVYDLIDIKLLIGADSSLTHQEALAKAIKGRKSSEEILISSENSKKINGSAAFAQAVKSITGIFDDIVPNEGKKGVTIKASYPFDSSHYLVETEIGFIRIRDILFVGELSIKLELLPLTKTEYINFENQETISQQASVNFGNANYHHSLEMHKVSKNGETHFVLSTTKIS